MRKKLVSMIMAVAMILSVMVPAMAAGGNGQGNGQGKAPITLVSTIPADGAKDVAADQVITLQFSNNVTWSNKGAEHMYLTNAGLITLKDSEGNVVKAEVVPPEQDVTDPGSEEYQKLFVKPAETLKGNTTYTVEIAAGIVANNGKSSKDAYTVSFTTKSGGNGSGQGKMEPTLVSTIPADGAKDVAADQVITLQFSNNVTWSNKGAEHMYLTNAGLITLKDAEGNVVKAEIVPPEQDETDPTSKEYQKLFVKPSEVLKGNATYTVEIAAGIVANNGKTSKDAYTVSFTTKSGGNGSGQGKMEPTLVSTIPADGAKDVAADQVITLQFSNNVTWSNKGAEHMYLTNAGLVTLKDSEGNVVKAEVVPPEQDETDPTSKEYQKLFVKPTEALKADTAYTVEIAAGIVANNGKTSKDAYTVSFTTRAAAEVPACWYTEAMDFAAENALLDGAPAMEPNDTVTRGMLVQILWNLEKKPAATASDSFADVAEDAWYAEAVNWAAEKGIVNGNGSGFAPEDSVTREQLAAILWRYKGQPETEAKADFADQELVSVYAVPAVAWAAEAGILKGMGENMLVPQGQATCAQIAVMLMRMVSTAK